MKQDNYFSAKNKSVKKTICFLTFECSYTMKEFNTIQFKTASLITFLFSVLLFALNYSIGTNQFFLMINHDWGKLADACFIFFTFLGDGIWWIAILILFYLFRRNHVLLLVYTFITSESIIESFKFLILPNELRPIKAIGDINLIHTAAGVEMHTIASFPSGHTTQAFVFFLLASLVIERKWVIPVGLLYALLIGYSRVYLAQHFPRDVAGGMLTALISVTISLWLFNKTKKALTKFVKA